MIWSKVSTAFDPSCHCEGTGRGSRGATVHDGAMTPCTCHGCMMLDPCPVPRCRFAIGRLGAELIQDGAIDDVTWADVEALRRKP